jgi:hypothetical protein
MSRLKNLRVIPGWMALAVLACGMTLTACGSTKTVTNKSGEAVSRASGKGSDVDFAYCLRARESHELGEKMIAEGQKALADGSEVEAAKANVRIGERMVRQGLERCAVEADPKKNPRG